MAPSTLVQRSFCPVPYRAVRKQAPALVGNRTADTDSWQVDQLVDDQVRVEARAAEKRACRGQIFRGQSIYACTWVARWMSVHSGQPSPVVRHTPYGGLDR